MPKGKNIDAFKSELKEFQKLAKRADERLRQIRDNYSKRKGFENMINWAYKKAMRDIKHWSGNDATTFNQGASKLSLNQLRAKKHDVEEFLNAPTSKISSTVDLYQRRADTINERYGTSFSWEELGTVFEDKENNDFYQKGGISYVEAVGYMKDNEEALLQSLEDNSRVVIRTGSRKANQMARDLIGEYGLDFTKLYKK